MILFINSEVANIGSWERILKEKKIKFIYSNDIDLDLKKIKKIIFPGVGNFGKVMKNIKSKNLDKTIISLINNQNVKYLGICVGMQILLQYSEESNCEGLNLVMGINKKINFPNFPKIHNGWNNNKIIKINSKITRDINNIDDFYFNHSYYCQMENDKDLIAHLEGHPKIATIIHKNNLFGVQFHPEKSHDNGLKLINNFLEI